MHMNKLSHNKSGFTIIELMIATMVFSFVLLVCAAAIVHVGRMYYKGVIIGRTQDVSRRVIEEVTQSIQFGPHFDDPAAFRRTASTPGSGGITVNAYCLGETRYSYITTHALGSSVTATTSPHVLWRDRPPIGPCTALDITNPANTPSGSGEELLSQNMRLPYFDIPLPTGNLWTVSARVAFGADVDLFEGGVFVTCKGTSAGGQFCAVSEFSTSVVKRL
jgi:prepilin-type N-terminal cleavage/methylation domain-containing protein